MASLTATSKALQLKNNAKFGNIIKAFRFNDKDHNGYLTKDELRAVFFEYNVPMTSKMLDDLFASIDKDGTGKVDFATFSKFFDWRGLDVDGTM